MHQLQQRDNLIRHVGDSKTGLDVTVIGLNRTDGKDDSHILLNVELNKFIYVERFKNKFQALVN